MGLGPAGKGGVPLAEARGAAEACREQIRKGLDPIEARKAEKSKGGTSFREVAEALHAARQDGWRSEKTRKHWLRSLERHCGPIWNMDVADIEVADVVKVLRPIWTSKAETAGKVRSRIQEVLDAAKHKGMIADDRRNPAQWRGVLVHELPQRQSLQRGHFRSMPYGEIAAFVAAVRTRPATAARCLEFLILNASRSAEALGGRWSEIDLVARLWTIPGERMKEGKAHVVPLSSRALEILAEMQTLRTAANPFVFPGTKAGKGLSPMALEMLMRRMKVENATPHGFRATFRTWAGDCTSHPREVAELALAHAVGNEVERSYNRGTALERRRALMQQWADFLDGVMVDNVVSLQRASA
jgi:integrase